MRAFFLALLVMAASAVTGCGGGPTKTSIPNLAQAMPVDPPGGSYMLTVNTFAGDALHKMLLLRMGSNGGILTTSFVDLHDFDKTSAFGRIVSQQIGSRIGQYGFRVIEARLASTLSMTPRAGEFMLTRETARLLEDSYDAGAVLVGTYSDLGNNIFVSARVVRLSDNAIMAAYEYTLPRDADVNRLLTGGGHGIDGDGVWSRHARRTPAFSTGVSPEGTGPAKAANGKSAPKRSPVERAAAPETQGGGGVVVPRHVDPVPRAPAPAKAPAPAVQAARAAPPPAPAVLSPVAAPSTSPAPLAPDKDAPAPAGVPGGR